ncbi:hypothetical protein ACOSQ2_018582 [Xanthoceras sorbifolium]
MKILQRPLLDSNKPLRFRFIKRNSKNFPIESTGYLKNEVHLDVKIKQLRSLTDAIGVAHLVEEKNSLQKRGASAFRPLILGTPPKSGNATPAGILGPPPGVKTAATTNVPPITFKRITSQEARTHEDMFEQLKNDGLPEISFHKILELMPYHVR